MSRAVRSALATLTLRRARGLGYLSNGDGGDGGDGGGDGGAGGDGGTGDAGTATAGDSGTSATGDSGSAAPEGGDVAVGDGVAPSSGGGPAAPEGGDVAIGEGVPAPGDSGAIATGESTSAPAPGASDPAPGDPGGGAAGPSESGVTVSGSVPENVPEPALSDPVFISENFVGSRNWAGNLGLIEQVSGPSLYGWYESSAAPMRDRIYSTYYTPIVGRVHGLIEPDYFARAVLRDFSRIYGQGYTEGSNTARIELEILGLYLNQPVLVALRGHPVNVYASAKAQTALAAGQAAADARWAATQKDSGLFGGIAEFLSDVGPVLTVARIGSMIYTFGASEGVFSAADALSEGGGMLGEDFVDYAVEFDSSVGVPDVDYGLEFGAAVDVGPIDIDLPAVDYGIEFDSSAGVPAVDYGPEFDSSVISAPVDYGPEFDSSVAPSQVDYGPEFDSSVAPSQVDYGPEFDSSARVQDFSAESEYGPGERPGFTDERAPGETPGTLGGASPWPNVSVSNMSTAFSVLRSLFATDPASGRAALTYLNDQLTRDGRPTVTPNTFTDTKTTTTTTGTLTPEQVRILRERGTIAIRGGAGAAPPGLKLGDIANTIKANPVPFIAAGALALYLFQQRNR